MLLAPVDQIRKDLGFDEGMGDIIDASAAALHAAEAFLAGLLDCEFVQAPRIDRYRTTPSRACDGWITSFRLSSGFVRLDTITTEIWGETVDLVAKADVNAESGVVTVYDQIFGHNLVRVGYTAGFPVDPTNPEAYDPAAVPSWLRQAALLKAKAMLVDSPAITQAEIKIDTTTLDANFVALISRRLRYWPSALVPL